ncbi:MAG: flagellar filament capping protein FliD [Arcobacteraceae bacterium]|nr:flagellar filament capping protein FliD [Arcobacteraceae bacterium]
MAEGVLGLAGGGSAALSQEVIDKLKAAERKATVEPIEAKLESWETESATMLAINALNLELITSFKALSLDNTTNAFEQKTATTSGTAVNYDVDDVSALIEGTTNITISQLAQKDVYQTGTFADKTVQVDGGNDSGDLITISIGGTDYDFSTEGKTYEELATDINNNSNFNASVEQVDDSSYRLIIKSAESGTASALTINQTGVNIGINSEIKSSTISSTTSQIVGGDDVGDKITLNGIDFTTKDKSYEMLADEINAHADFNASIVNSKLAITRVDGADVEVTQTGVDLGFTSAVVSAQNLQATIDGVSYDVSSNSITTQGSLTITANEVGDSSITIRQDTSTILTGVNDMVSKYNSMITLIDAELNSTDSSVQDKSSLRLMKSSMKDILFDSYGASSDKNIFNFGFSLDTSGFLSIDEAIFNTAVSDDLDSLKALFIGTAENKGLGTLLYTYADALDGYEGLLSQYADSMTSRKTTLDEDLESEIEALDSKYELMAAEFAAYGSLIATMEAQFGSLKMMIDQSISGS